MDTKTKSLAEAYDEKYRQGQYFKYREWLYRPFVKALAKAANLRAGSTVLDVGCGQGFFSWLFADLGLRSLGIDISAEAIRCAERDYSSSGARFEVGDIHSLKYQGAYDCVFARGLSLYNSTEFNQCHDVTDALLACLKPSGVMIFGYHTNFCARRKSESWIYHSFSDAKEHFSSYPGAKVYFSLRIETLLFGSYALRFPFTHLDALISRSMGIGGEIIAFVPRSTL
jgi:2-polyprenyl-3-methyl-5-hydroxy-6-metoxy-1,4-benzoquinol methylase